jgi:hypothetical protein
LEELIKPSFVSRLNLSQGTSSSNEARSQDQLRPPSRQKKEKKEETQKQMENRGSCALILSFLA